MERMDRINNWDLVDVSCPFVSAYLYDRPRDVLCEMARSKSLWERRTAIVSTYYFIRQGDLDDTFKIAEMLLGEEEDVIHKAAGGWLRAAGEKDVRRLRYFLDEHDAAHYASLRHRTPRQEGAQAIHGHEESRGSPMKERSIVDWKIEVVTIPVSDVES